MNIGYARVSTQDQNLALQHKALPKVPCNRVFTNTAPGAKTYLVEKRFELHADGANAFAKRCC